MNWPLIFIEIVVALATFQVLHRMEAFERQSSIVQILIGGIVLFILFTLVRYFMPNVPAL